MEWPEIDESMTIDSITRAFEEGWHQGRAHAARTVPRASWFGKVWQFAAAAAAVFVGVVAGGYVWTNMQANAEVAELRGDVQSLQETIAMSLLENRSASQRLRGLQWTQHVEQPGARLVNELSHTRREDRSVNVRLAAADVMVRFADNPQVRDALYETVLTDTDPFVQVHLIDALLVVPYPKTQNVLTRLAESHEVTDVVRVKAIAALNEMGDQ